MKQLLSAIFTLFLFLVTLNSVIAQQNHFIYIQTENKQPFYVKLDKKIYSSSASGYLLVPKLKDGTYQLAIGFPKSEWSEQNMICTIDKNDVGFLLKDFGSKGWGLFNFQTLAVIMPVGKEKVENIEVINNTDAFSNMLSNVVNDSTIRQTEAVKTEVKKVPVIEEKPAPIVTQPIVPLPGPVVIETKKAVAPLNSGQELKTTTGGVKDSGKVDVAKQTVSGANVTRSAITRSLFNKNEEGTEMIFFDVVNGKKDTIRVFIPAEKTSVAVKEEKPKEKEEVKEEQKSGSVKQPESPKDSRFLDIELPNPNQQQPVVKTEGEKTNNQPATKSAVEKSVVKDTTIRNVMINSDCKNFASDDDFLKLRKKMAAEDNDDDMINIAKKTFKTRCFSVEQIKNLSVLFLKDSGKYNFFDAVYPFVADSHNFSTLQSQLTESYYINRFQVMIRH